MEPTVAELTIDGKVKNLIQRELVVFDFDETLVDCNSDSWIHTLAPGNKIPEHLKYQPNEYYFKHVQSVLAYLHSENVTEQQYQQCLNSMPPVLGMIDPLITTLAQQPDKYDMIILSDSNSYLIGTYLKARSLDNFISAVLTNPARFAANGQLLIDEYHIQDYCPISTRNLCKGEALKNYIAKRVLDHNVVYTRINYVGDGDNDLCPSIRLGSCDRVFPRMGYALAKLIAGLNLSDEELYLNVNSFRSNAPELKATVVPWTSGEEILSTILGIGAAAC